MRLRIQSLLVLGAALALGGCAMDVGTEAESQETVAETQQELVNNGYWMGQSTGKLYSNNSPKNWEGVQSWNIQRAAYDSNFRTYYPNRFTIVNRANTENAWGLYGDYARSRYGASGGWCTEYARWLFRWSGARNIRYCETNTFLGCWDYRYLSEATVVDHMRRLFSANGGWVGEGSVSINQLLNGYIKPGDYVALRGCDGSYRGHSGVVMAISSDLIYMWTSEGNRCGSAVQMHRRPFVVNGRLHGDINGFGRVNVAF